MKRIYLTIIISVGVFILNGCQHTQQSQQPKGFGEESESSSALLMGTLKLTSSQFQHEGVIPAKYSCDGVDINPPLAIDGAPEGTMSLALIVYDPDAPVGTFDHWILWNIKPRTKDIFENSVPVAAVQGKNDFRRVAYGGPCPPSGTHRYYFKLYALDTLLTLDASGDKKALEEAMKGHILDQAVLMGKYTRQ